MHILFAHKATDSFQDLLFYLYRLFLTLMLSDLLSFSFYSTPTSDLQTTWIDSTFSTCLCTHLQNHYFDALSDPESLTKTTYHKSSSSIFSKGLDYSKLLYQLILQNHLTHFHLGFLLLYPYYRINTNPIHACYILNIDLIQTLTYLALVAIPTHLLSSSNRLYFLF